MVTSTSPEFQPQQDLRDNNSASKPAEHIPFLDHIRGAAIILVFLFHALSASFATDHLEWNGWLRDFHVSRKFLLLLPLTYGWSGVAIFFVVSGFCIHLSHERSRSKQLKVFFVRRFFRIYPPYFIAVMFFAFLYPITKLKFASLQDFAQLGSHVFMVHNFDQNSYFGINGSFWSIAVEAQLYLLYPLLLLVVQHWGWAGALWLTGIIEITLRTICAVHPMPIWFALSPFTFWFSWTIGAALADDFLKKRPLMLRKCPIWFWLLATIVCSFFKPLESFGFTCAALFAANLIAFLLSRSSSPPPKGESFAFACVLKHLEWVGIISYSVYLFHQPFLRLIAITIEKLSSSHHTTPTLTFVGCLLEWPLVLLFSYGFYKFVEKPSITLGKWFLSTKLVNRRES